MKLEQKKKKSNAKKPALVSMSGFGSGRERDKSYSVTVELRSLNSRYFDCSVRLPQKLSGALEAKIKEQLEAVLQRGRVEVIVTLGAQGSSGARAVFDHSLFLQGQELIRKNLLRSTKPSKQKSAAATDKPVEAAMMAVLWARKEIFDIVREDDQKIFDDKLLWKAFAVAQRQICEMRVREGARLSTDISDRLAELETVRAEISGLIAPQLIKMQRDLKLKIEALLGTATVDSQRLEQEVALIVSRTDVHEELVRLASHMQEFTRLMTQENCGKRLDFLTQEFLRELNTIGSKVSLAEAQHAVVAGKGIVERIKEQVQNVA